MIDEESKLTVRRKLTENFIESLEGKEKAQIFNDEVPGLKVMVQSILDKKGNRRNIKPNEVSKGFYYSWRPKGSKPKRLFLGSTKELSRAAALRRVNEIKSKIFSGHDPVLIKQSLQKELDLGALIKEFYQNRLNKNHGYKPKTIKHVKDSFRVWIFQQTTDKKCRDCFTYDIQYKKISKVTKEAIKNVHNAIGSKAPYVANRVIQYLKIVFNYAIEKGYLKKENPCKIKRKEMFQEKENHTVLTKGQAQQVIDLCFVTDNRNEKPLLNLDHYKRHDLNIIACTGIAFALLTGKRQLSEGFALQWKQVNEATKTLSYLDSKVGQKTYKFSNDCLQLLQTIRRSRFLECYNFNDERREYVFPSPKKDSQQKYFTGFQNTWKKVLRILNIPYMPLKQCRHTFGTLLLSSSKNISVVQKALGHTNSRTTMKYARILDADVESALDSFNMLNADEAQDKNKVIEFKK